MANIGNNISLIWYKTYIKQKADVFAAQKALNTSAFGKNILPIKSYLLSFI